MFSFAENKPPLRKDVEAATGADRYSTYLRNLTLNSISEYPSAIVLLLCLSYSPNKSKFYFTKKMWQKHSLIQFMHFGSQNALLCSI